MKLVCRRCFGRLHPLGYGCPLGLHVLAAEGEPCTCSIHVLTDLELMNRTYFPERLEV